MARIEQVLSGEKTWGQYSLDILGHVGLGTAYAIVPVALYLFLNENACVLCAIVGGTLIALIGGMIREYIQFLKTGKDHFNDRFWDSIHHIIGGPTSVGLALLVKFIINLSS